MIMFKTPIQEKSKAIDYLKLKRCIDPDFASHYIDMAIEALERDIQNDMGTHRRIICPQCGYYLIEDIVNNKEDKNGV